MPTIAIIGASQDRNKFGNQAVRKYSKAGYDVYPVHPTAKEIEGIEVFPTIEAVPADHLDRISVYLPPAVGMTLLEAIAAKGADEVWFNPGSESDDLLDKAESLGINAIADCSLVALENES